MILYDIVLYDMILYDMILSTFVATQKKSFRPAPAQSIGNWRYFGTSINLCPQ